MLCFTRFFFITESNNTFFYSNTHGTVDDRIYDFSLLRYNICIKILQTKVNIFSKSHNLLTQNSQSNLLHFNNIFSIYEMYLLRILTQKG